MKVRAASKVAGRGVATSLEHNVGEALGGSVQAMMRAAGFDNEKDFFKAVEAGEVMADVLPKFALELRKMAREGGALDAVVGKTRSEMNRFLSDLTRAKDAIFQGGMDEGLSYMFGTLSQIMKDLAPAAKAFGAAFQGAISTISGALRAVLSPLHLFTQTLASLGLSDKSTGLIWNLVGAGGALMLMAAGFNRVALAIGLTNAGLLVTMGRLLALVAPALLVQDVIGGAFGQNSVLPSPSFKDQSVGGFMANWSTFSSNPILSASRVFSEMYNSQKVEITVKDGEFSKVIDAKVVEGSQKQQAALASETGG